MNDAMPAMFPSAFRAHPWHGVDLGPESPDVVTAYVEIVPTDTVKYELDKASGLLKVDRPQLFSNAVPSLYGFFPRTLCGERVAAYCMARVGRTDIVGDADPLDICVLTEKSIGHGDLLVKAIPIGGLRMIDHDEADDKIIAVMNDDAVYGRMRDIGDCPPQVIERLRHYFLTYKQVPGDGTQTKVEITHVFGREEAHDIIRASQADYDAAFMGADIR